MGNWTATRPATLTPLALDAVRNGSAGGSDPAAVPASRHRPRHRRRADRVPAGTPASSGRAPSIGFAGPIVIGTIDDLWPRRPCQAPACGWRAGLCLPCQGVRPVARPGLGLIDGESPDGSGATTNVRALSKRCPHLGCQPELLHQELALRVRLPPVALRPTGHQDPAPRSRAAEHGPLRHLRHRRRPDHRHEHHQARAAARRPGPAGSVPPTSPTGCI